MEKKSIFRLGKKKIEIKTPSYGWGIGAVNPNLYISKGREVLKIFKVVAQRKISMYYLYHKSSILVNKKCNHNKKEDHDRLRERSPN